MKRLVLLTTLLLTACGPSPEEKQEIAIITCNIIGESRDVNASSRIKEVNIAREKMGEDAFLLSDGVIQESLNWGLCNELVLNVANYDELLESKKQQLTDTIGGFWFHKYYDTEDYEGFILIAELVNQKIIINKYYKDESYESKQPQLVLDYKIIDNNRLGVTGNQNVNNFIISVDLESESLSFF